MSISSVCCGSNIFLKVNKVIDNTKSACEVDVSQNYYVKIWQLLSHIMKTEDDNVLNKYILFILYSEVFVVKNNERLSWLVCKND